MSGKRRGPAPDRTLDVAPLIRWMGMSDTKASVTLGYTPNQVAQWRRRGIGIHTADRVTA